MTFKNIYLVKILPTVSAIIIGTVVLFLFCDAYKNITNSSSTSCSHNNQPSETGHAVICIVAACSISVSTGA